MNIAILGLGTVGSGACKAVKSAIDLEVTRILVRRPKPEYADLQTEDIDDILNDPNIDLVAECIGGIHPALEYVLGAMEHGKHVVTANKALVSALRRIGKLCPEERCSVPIHPFCRWRHSVAVQSAASRTVRHH